MGLICLAGYQQPIAEDAPGRRLQRRREDSLRHVEELSRDFQASQAAGHLRDQELPLKTLDERDGRIR